MLIDLLNGELEQQEYLIINNVKIIYKKLPKKIYGFIHRYRNINLIVINWNISKEKKQKTILHELAHIELNQLNQIDSDLFAFKTEQYEDEADRYIKYLLANIN